GIEHAWLPARLEQRLLDGVEWVFDVAHNPAAACVLADELAGGPKPRRTIAVFAAMADKDLTGIIEPLIPVVDDWLVTRADTERGASEETIMAVLKEQHAGSATARPVVAEACRHARSLAAVGDRVLVFGSCYMVGPAMAALGLYCGPNQPDDRTSRWTGV
ncbi:MAG: cyanophycin synthetase, partial [Gammaproteobacteria bacterium]